ncbi:uncharacterized protein [Rutidosis leptorrhynchoides]|uniref:uncharacterized protein n=1 Tax=Rutidosis leptorrhynchoides TaxID=125765 RepID=UPI003A999040
MLRAYVLEYGGSWDTHLPLVELAYNNSYHLNIGMPPYEMLYGRRCRTLICWLEVGEKQFAGPKIVQMIAKKVFIAREKCRRGKGVIRFGKHGKLVPRYIGPYPIREILNDKTVVLELPPELAGIHNTFNVCYLRKCKVDDETQVLPIKDLKVDLSNKLVEEPIRMVDRKGGWGFITVPREVAVCMRSTVPREVGSQAADG